MLNQEIAQGFIDRLGQVLELNINIMDSQGVIIASGDPLRVGTFHQIAREVLVKELEGIVVSKDELLPAGVRPGINLPVVLDGNLEGVIGITGDTLDLTNVAVALKSSLETMLEYERLREEQHQTQDRRRILSNSLLFHDSTTKTQRNRILVNLGLHIEHPRVAVVFDVPPTLITSLTQVLQSPGFYGNQDIFLQTPDGRIVVFKALNLDSLPILDGATEQVEKWSEAIFQNITKPITTALSPKGDFFSTETFCYVGSIQYSPELYSCSYRHAVWTQQYLDKKNRKSGKQGRLSRTNWFWDHSQDYLFSLSAPSEIESIASLFDRALKGKERKMTYDTLRALDKSGIGLKETASDLGIHRNTLLLRLQKIRESLGLDPVNRNRDRELAKVLCYLMNR